MKEVLKFRKTRENTSELLFEVSFMSQRVTICNLEHLLYRTPPVAASEWNTFKSNKHVRAVFSYQSFFFNKYRKNPHKTLHKKWSFPFRVSSVNVTKSADSCGFGHICWRNPKWKNSFFVQWNEFFFFWEKEHRKIIQMIQEEILHQVLSLQKYYHINT